MNTPAIAPLIRQHGIISDQVTPAELTVLLEELCRVLETTTAGAVVEFGCYSGTTSLYIRRLLDHYQANMEFHVYDSFVGLPGKTGQDISPAGEQFKAGELAVPKKEFLLNFKKAALRPPAVHKAWFSELTPSDVPDAIGFAFLDGDYYESIRDSLVLITPKLSPGAVIIVDDYMNEALPGAAIATDEWLRMHPAKLRAAHSLAIIHR